MRAEQGWHHATRYEHWDTKKRALPLAGRLGWGSTRRVRTQTRSLGSAPRQITCTLSPRTTSRFCSLSTSSAAKSSAGARLGEPPLPLRAAMAASRAARLQRSTCWLVSDSNAALTAHSAAELGAALGAHASAVAAAAGARAAGAGAVAEVAAAAAEEEMGAAALLAAGTTGGGAAVGRGTRGRAAVGRGTGGSVAGWGAGGRTARGVGGRAGVGVGRRRVGANAAAGDAEARRLGGVGVGVGGRAGGQEGADGREVGGVGREVDGFASREVGGFASTGGRRARGAVVAASVVACDVVMVVAVVAVAAVLESSSESVSVDGERALGRFADLTDEGAVWRFFPAAGSVAACAGASPWRNRACGLTRGLPTAISSEVASSATVAVRWRRFDARSSVEQPGVTAGELADGTRTASSAVRLVPLARRSVTDRPASSTTRSALAEFALGFVLSLRGVE